MNIVQQEQLYSFMQRMDIKFRDFNSTAHIYSIDNVYIDKELEDKDGGPWTIILLWTNLERDKCEEKLITVDNAFLARQLYMYAYRRYLWNWG